MRRFFLKSVVFTLLAMILTVAVSSAYVFFTDFNRDISYKQDIDKLRIQYQGVKTQFDSNYYKDITATLSQMGKIGVLDSAIEEFKVTDYPFDNDWDKSFFLLFGNTELDFFLSKEPSEFLGVEETLDKDSGGYPNMTLVGITFSQGGRRAVSMLQIDSKPAIWLWEKKSDKWATETTMPGYKIEGESIDRDTVTFILYPVEQIGKRKKISLTSSPAEKLADFKKLSLGEGFLDKDPLGQSSEEIPRNDGEHNSTKTFDEKKETEESTDGMLNP